MIFAWEKSTILNCQHNFINCNRYHSQYPPRKDEPCYVLQWDTAGSILLEFPFYFFSIFPPSFSLKCCCVTDLEKAPSPLFCFCVLISPPFKFPLWQYAFSVALPAQGCFVQAVTEFNSHFPLRQPLLAPTNLCSHPLISFSSLFFVLRWSEWSLHFSLWCILAVNYSSWLRASHLPC